VNDQGEHLVEPGKYHLFVGGAQPGDSAAGIGLDFEIMGEAKLPR
jgi:hypothetical protein